MHMHAVPFTLLLAASSSVAYARPRIATAAPAPASTAVSPPTPRATQATASPSVSVPPVVRPASPGPPTSPSAQPALPPPLRDRAANLIGGVWQCDTIAGNTGTHTYAQNEDDGSIEVAIELHAASRTFYIRENYRYDDGRKLWTARTQGDAFVGTAPPWTGYKWIFEGTQQERGEKRAVRMVYFDLADQAFRRDFQAKQDGTWKTYSAETCKRPSN